MGATIVSAGIGYGVAHQSDERLWLEQRAALRNAISEFRILFGDAKEIDPRFVRMVEQSARLQGLKYETEPVRERREMQPVLDGKGRIAGFFTWDKTRPMTTAMGRSDAVYFRRRLSRWSALPAFRCGNCGAPGANWRRARIWRSAPPTPTS